MGVGSCWDKLRNELNSLVLEGSRPRVWSERLSWPRIFLRLQVFSSWPRWEADITGELRPELREADLGRIKECMVSGGLGFEEGHLRNHLENRLGEEEAVFRAGGRSQRHKDNTEAPT